MGLREVFKMASTVDEQFSTPKTLPSNATRPLTASGQRINLKSEADTLLLRNRIYQEWQNDAWAYYDAIGEIKYAFTMASNVISRIRLYPGLNFEQDAVPIAVDSYRDKMARKTADEHYADRKMHQALPQNITPEMLEHAERLVHTLLNSGPGGQSGFLRSFALNILVAGECYLINHKGRWTIRSSSEVVISNTGQVVLRTQRAGPSVTGAQGLQGDIPLPKGTFIGRIWREHPRYSDEPESSMLAIRESCEEAVALQRYIRTVTRSRMNAGILFLPEGLIAASASVTDDIASAEEEMAALASELYEALTAPVADETSSASVVPTIVTGPADKINGKIEYIPIQRAVDQFLVQHFESVMGRILGGLDVPKDMVQGMTGMRYSNATAMNDHMYSAQIEPMVLMLCDTLTYIYLRPMMKKAFPQLGQRELDYFSMWYDPSEVVTKSDPTASADKGLDNFSLSGDVWRRNNGYSDSDAPSEQELALRFLLTKAPPQPEMIDMLFKQAFPSIVDNARRANLEKAPIPMPESAQELLYGEVLVEPGQTTVDGQNKPRTAEQVANPVQKVASLPDEANPEVSPTTSLAEIGAESNPDGLPIADPSAKTLAPESTGTGALDVDYSDDNGGDGQAAAPVEPVEEDEDEDPRKKKKVLDIDFSDDNGGD